MGRKIAATLASTGTPAMFVHPAEASHGDLGMITRADVVLAISNSGESEELTAILPLIKRMGVPLLAMTGRAGSSLGRHADVVLDTGVEGGLPAQPGADRQHDGAARDGRRLRGRAAERARLRPDDFARSHPGGALGRKLLTLVSDVMRPADLTPRRPAGVLERDDARDQRQGPGRDRGGRCGRTAGRHLHRWRPATPDRGRHRTAQRHGRARHASRAAQLRPDAPRSRRKLMETHRVNSLLVVDADGRTCGALNSNDLMRAKVI